MVTQSVETHVEDSLGPTRGVRAAGHLLTLRPVWEVSVFMWGLAAAPGNVNPAWDWQSAHWARPPASALIGPQLVYLGAEQVEAGSLWQRQH